MDALIFYDVANTATTTTMDLGTVAIATSDDTQLRVYNSSSFYQATGVTVSVTGANATDLWLSTDGLSFYATADVGDIAPGGYSPIFWMRRISDGFSINGSRTATVLATSAGWIDPDVDSATSDIIPLDTSDN